MSAPPEDSPEPTPEPPSATPDEGASERRIVADARGGDEEAVARLLAQIEGDMTRVVERKSGQRLARFASGDDLKQEIALRVVRALPHLRPAADLSDVRAIMRQHADWVLQRRGSSASRFAGESVEGTAPPDGRERVAGGREGSTTTGAVTRADDLRWMGERIARLDDKHRVVLVMRAEGRSFAEIAAELSITEEAARKRYQRGLKQLER